MRKLNPEYLEAVKPVVNRSPFFALLGMSLRDVGMGSSILEIDVRKKHIQPFGAVHGGVFASIIDASAFWAVYSEVDENVGMTTVDLKVNYLAPARSGKLIAKAASEDGEHLEGLLDIREGRHPRGFDNPLALLHVTFVATIGNQEWFGRVLLG